MKAYYGITRSDEYLVHYGIKGMKWGVRKAIERGNQRALSRQYRKAQRKLQRLQRMADSSDLIKRADRLDRVSKVARTAGRIGLGTAAATTGFSGIPGTAVNAYSGRNLIANRIINNRNSLGSRIKNAYNGAQGADTAAWRSQQNALADSDYKRKLGKLDKVDKISQVAQKVGAGLAVGGYATSAAAKLRARQLRNQATGQKHREAVARASEFQREMNQAFKGTQYANGASKKRARKRR